MIEIRGVLKEGNDGGYIIRALDTPIILLDKQHAPTQQYLKAYGRKMLGESVAIMVVDQSENFWIGQISPEELKSKGFGRVAER